MAIADDLGRVADLCAEGAKKALVAKLSLGAKPQGHVDGLLWELRMQRLDGQLNSLTALNSKLTAASVLTGLADLAGELTTIGKVSADAQAKIKKINDISELLKKLAKVLDLGLALVAAAAAPSPATVAAVLTAGTAVAEGI